MGHSRVVSDHWGHLSTPEQRARLLERTASARELAEAQRAELRGEMERLRSEREEAMAEFRVTLTEEQLRQLQGLARAQRFGPRSDRTRFRGQSRRQSFRGGDDTFRPRSLRRGLAGRFVPRRFSRRGASLRRGPDFRRDPTFRRGRGWFRGW